MSTLADTMRSMDVSRFSRLAYFIFPFPISRATGSCTRTFPFLFHMFSYLYQYGLSTHLLTFPDYTCLLLSRQLVCLCFSLMLFHCSLSTCLPSRYSWTLTRL